MYRAAAATTGLGPFTPAQILRTALRRAFRQDEHAVDETARPMNNFFPQRFSRFPHNRRVSPRPPLLFPHMTFQSSGYFVKRAAAFRLCPPPVYQDRLGFLPEQCLLRWGKREGVWGNSEFVGKSEFRWEIKSIMPDLGIVFRRARWRGDGPTRTIAPSSSPLSASAAAAARSERPRRGSHPSGRARTRLLRPAGHGCRRQPGGLGHGCRLPRELKAMVVS